MSENLPEVTSEHITANDKDVLLFTVKNGLGRIGICRVGNSEENTACLYSNDVPVLFISGLDKSDYYDITVTERGSLSGSSAIGKAVDEAYKQLCAGTAPEYALPQILRLMNDGLYAVTYDKAYPTYGDNMFFWSSYGMPKLLKGSSRYVRPIPEGKSYTAPFIVPTHSSASYDSELIGNAERAGRRAGSLFGITLHISGLYSALVKGHYAATASIVADEPFYAFQIQRVGDIWKEKDEEGVERVVGLRSASFKIPFTSLGREQQRVGLTARKYPIPPAFDSLRNKLCIVKNQNSGRIPKQFNKFSECYPDADMVASAQGIDELTKPMLDALLAGSTTLNDKVMISDNYYSSVTAACNYLRYHSTDAFIAFALDIMKNPDLSATYSYVAGCMAKITDKRIKQFFDEVLNSNDSGYAAITSVAKSYVDNYGKQEGMTREEYMKTFLSASPSYADKLMSLNTPSEQIVKDKTGAELVARHVSRLMNSEKIKATPHN